MATPTCAEKRVNRLQNVIRGNVVVFNKQHGGTTFHSGRLHSSLKNNLQLSEPEPSSYCRREYGTPLHIRHENLLVQWRGVRKHREGGGRVRVIFMLIE